MTQQTVPPARRPWLGLMIAVLMALAVAAAQLAAPATSYQWANIVSFLCGAIGLIAAAVWWARFYRGGLAVRLLPFAGLILAPTVLLYFYEVRGVTGEFWPELRVRGAVRAPLPEASASASLPPAETEQAWVIQIDDQSHPGFMGAGRDGKLARRQFSLDWENTPPQQVWKQPIGEGLAGVAVVRAIQQTEGAPRESMDEEAPTRWLGFTLEQRGPAECVVCYDLADGTPLWQYEEPGRHANPMGDVGPRTTPTIDGDGRLYAQGATGKVWCFEAITGALLWKVDLLELADIDQGTFEEHVPWGRSGSPLRVEDLVVLPLGGAPQSPRGTRSLVALDAASGEVRWTSGGHQISYASPVVATIGGVRQIVAVDEDFVSGTGLEDAEELWSEPWPGKSNQGANCSNPIVFPDGRVLVSKEYGGGAKMFRVERSGDRWETEVLWEDHRVLKTKFTNAVVDGGYAYAISNGTMECVDLSDGSRQWRQGRGQRVGNGHLVLVEDALVSSTEQGGIVLVERTPAEYRERGRFSAIEGKTWNPPTVFSNYVLLRNGREMALYRLPPLTPDAAASIARAARESPAAHRTDD